MERRPCSNQDSCPLFQSRSSCFEDVHHLFYPANQYRTGVAKEFRELDENKVRICRQEHNDTHATELPPEKPELDDMRDAITASRFALRALKNRRNKDVRRIA
jgi:hypothetical protein